VKQQPIDKVQQVPAKHNSPFTAREVARAKLKEAGVLANDLVLPADLAPVSEEELEQLGEMRPGARPSEEIIAQVAEGFTTDNPIGLTQTPS
jgi:hypothetical protein